MTTVAGPLLWALHLFLFKIEMRCSRNQSCEFNVNWYDTILFMNLFYCVTENTKVYMSCLYFTSWTLQYSKLLSTALARFKFLDRDGKIGKCIKSRSFQLLESPNNITQVIYNTMFSYHRLIWAMTLLVDAVFMEPFL